MRTPLFVLAVLVFSSFPGSIAGADEGPSVPALPPLTRSVPESKPVPVTVTEAMTGRLKKASWNVLPDGSLERVEGKAQGFVPVVLLKHADFLWRNGTLVYDRSYTEIEDAQLGPVLEGLAFFAAAGSVDRRDIGRALALWGVPPAFDGRKLIEPDGTATYFGFMLHQALDRTPGAKDRLSGERLSQALNHFNTAYDQAFGGKQAPDIALTYVKRAWSVLAAQVRPGETAVSMRPYADLGDALTGRIAAVKAELQAAVTAGDDVRRGEAQSALAALSQLEKVGYHGDKRLSALVPRPAGPGETPPGSDDRTPPVSLTGSLPVVLRVLDRINGKPLTAEQQESLIKSFPGGELVWRLGVQELWRDGITGKGVRVAVIDEGIAPHSELDDAVKARRNFTAQRGAATVGEHGTHVAGIIRAVAPDAEIRGYAVLSGGGSNPLLERPNHDGIVKAIDAAVADGNRVINLSLGSGGGPSDVVARAIERYTSQGVIFIVATGNERDSRGLNSPSVALNALSVGNLDVNGRPWVSSSYGANFDPERLSVVAKTIFMVPGTNIYSTLPGDKFGPMTGTSMASPGLAGVSALLYQAVTGYYITPDPVSASRRVRDALFTSGQPMGSDRLPVNAPADQQVVVVNPVSAYQALSASVVAH